MRCRFWMMLATAVLTMSACESPEQPPAKAAPQVTTTPAPVPAPVTAPIPPAPPAVVSESVKATVAPPEQAPKRPVVPAAEIPESVILDASQGQVTLSHLDHAKSYPCATCHLDGPPGKLSLTKDAAHDLCRDCHKAKGAGPTTCTGCHKK